MISIQNRILFISLLSKSLNPNITFINNIELEQFKCVIPRDKLGRNQDKLGRNQEKLGRNQEKLGRKKMILNLLKENPKITIQILSEKIGITTTAIEKNLKYLKENNYIKRVGSTKGGHWEVIDKI